MKVFQKIIYSFLLFLFSCCQSQNKKESVKCYLTNKEFIEIAKKEWAKKYKITIKDSEKFKITAINDTLIEIKNENDTNNITLGSKSITFNLKNCSVVTIESWK